MALGTLGQCYLVTTLGRRPVVPLSVSPVKSGPLLTLTAAQTLAARNMLVRTSPVTLQVESPLKSPRVLATLMKSLLIEQIRRPVLLVHPPQTPPTLAPPRTHNCTRGVVTISFGGQGKGKLSVWSTPETLQVPPVVGEEVKTNLSLCLPGLVEGQSTIINPALSGRSLCCMYLMSVQKDP